MNRMKAVVAYGPKDYHLEEVKIPEVGPGDVLVKVNVTGICASDRSIYKGGDPWGGMPGKHIPGHEFAGTVVELGEGAGEATGLKIGDQATAELRIPCRTCYYCTHGTYHLCIQSRKWVGGSFAEYMLFPAGAIVWKVPDSIPPDAAALIEPLTCSAHAVERAGIGQTHTVVVAGLGAIGMGVIQIARLRNPYKLIGIDVHEKNCQTAIGLGADHAFNLTSSDVNSEIMDLTDGLGADIYIEVSGNPKSIETGLNVLRKRGRMAVYGVYRNKAEVDFNLVSEFKELEIVGGHLSPWVYPAVIQYLARGQVQAGPMISHTFPLSEFEIGLTINEKEPSIKTQLIP